MLVDMPTLRNPERKNSTVYAHWHSNMAMENGTPGPPFIGFHHLQMSQSSWIPWLCRPSRPKNIERLHFAGLLRLVIDVGFFLGCLSVENKSGNPKPIRHSDEFRKHMKTFPIGFHGYFYRGCFSCPMTWVYWTSPKIVAI